MTNPNDLAFPTFETLDGKAFNHGMNKREYFAAAAMQGLCAANWPRGGGHEDSIAIESVRIADALIAELNKGGEG